MCCYDYSEWMKERRTEKLLEDSCILKAKFSTDLRAFQNDTSFCLFFNEYLKYLENFTETKKEL
jgi:hypothetical protein